MGASAGTTLATILTALRDAGLLAAEPGVLPDHVSAITDDSRTVVSGGCFVAVCGTIQDGHDYIASARADGAAVVIVEDAGRAASSSSGSSPVIVVRHGRRAAAVAAAAFYGHPARALRLVAVTGTNGKTTTVGMLRHLLDAPAPNRAASIGTLGVLVGSTGTPVKGGGGLTTPGPVELQRVLRVLVDAGVAAVAMEVSSHSLAQQRVEGIEFDVAVFTNLTRDHLDYHGTMEEYFAAKAALVRHLKADGAAVVNVDDDAWAALPATPRRVTFGGTDGADVRARYIRYETQGSRFRLVTPQGAAEVSLPLIGDFNVTNAIGAAGAAHALGMDPSLIATRLASQPQVPGRLERIGERPTVLRDYAHTPDALDRALTTLRASVQGRLIVVFGAGGDRDPGKRPLMGAIAARLADVVIITSDNPRTEDPERIIDGIAAGIPGGGYERIEDRRAAIARAIAVADPEKDLVLLAGKGHETYQVRGSTKLPFDECQIVAELMAPTASAAGRPGGR